jgi:schlafen family protein
VLSVILQFSGFPHERHQTRLRPTHSSSTYFWIPEKRLPSLAALARSDDPLSDKQVLIQRLKLERPESRDLEWKLTLPFGPGATTRAKYRTVKTIIAYANTERGFILFGIDPHGTWAGVPQADIEAFDPASLEELLSGCVSPAIRQMSYAHLETDGLHFGVLHIPPSPTMPHVTTKEIREDSQGKKPTVLLTRWGVYCRHGAKSDLATPEDFERVIARRTDRADADGLRVYRLSSDPKAPAVRVTRTGDDSTATLVREELSGDLFSEINNVVNANSLLTEGRHQFSFAPEIYYRIYAERQHVETSVEHIELLARTALTRLNAPVLYWLVLLPPENAVELYAHCTTIPRVPT